MDNIFDQIETTLNGAKENSNKYVNNIINQAIKTETESEIESEYVRPRFLDNDPFEYKLTPDEIKLQNNFIGCYTDDPSNPTFKDYLGEVNNQEQCINMGKDKNYNYVGIQQGNKCFGANFVPEETQKVEITKCSTDCNDKSKGKCGGFYYSHIYSTTSKNGTDLTKPSDMVEKFKNLNIELFDISSNLQEGHFVTENPLNPYSLLLWLIVILIIIYIIIEYINKKSNEKNYYNN